MNNTLSGCMGLCVGILCVILACATVAYTLLILIVFEELIINTLARVTQWIVRYDNYRKFRNVEFQE
jgi:hypothetical protein